MAEEGIESTLAGTASRFSSLTTAEARAARHVTVLDVPPRRRARTHLDEEIDVMNDRSGADTRTAPPPTMAGVDVDARPAVVADPRALQGRPGPEQAQILLAVLIGAGLGAVFNLLLADRSRPFRAVDGEPIAVPIVH